MTTPSEDARLARARVWEEQRDRLERQDRLRWHRIAEERNRPLRSRRFSPRERPLLDPWNHRPGSEHWPPSDQAMAADRRRCRRAWGHFEHTCHRLRLQPVAGHAPVAGLDSDGNPLGLAPGMIRPLRFRAVLRPGSLAAMRVTRFFAELGCSRSWKTTLVGSRLLLSVSAGYTPVFEFWIAPCRRPGLEGCHEIVNTLLTGWDYRSTIAFDSSDYEIAPSCVAGLDFATTGPRGHWSQRGSQVALEPLLEAEGIDPDSPEAEVGVRHWWVADRGDDGFPYFDIDDTTDEALLNA